MDGGERNGACIMPISRRFTISTMPNSSQSPMKCSASLVGHTQVLAADELGTCGRGQPRGRRGVPPAVRIKDLRMPDLAADVRGPAHRHHVNTANSSTTLASVPLRKRASRRNCQSASQATPPVSSMKTEARARRHDAGP